MKFIFNKKSEDKKSLNELISVMNSDAALQSIAGLLFKTNFEDVSNCLHLGFLPAVIEGVRNYHYNIKLLHENEFNLIGFISANGEFKILFKPVTLNLSISDKTKYLNDIIILAKFLIKQGYKKSGILDFSTKELMQSLEIIDILPNSLKELSLIKI